MKVCKSIQKSLTSFDECVQTDIGYRVKTHCLYPSFETVYVYVVGFGDGFLVHDGAGASNASWEHGRDKASLEKYLKFEAMRFGLKVDKGSLVGDAVSEDWLASAIFSVANASATAANNSVAKSFRAATHNLQTRILDTLKSTVKAGDIAKEYEYVGKSGKHHRFDFAVTNQDILLLIDAVQPHHNSIAAKYMAFADTQNGVVGGRFAVFDTPLVREDKTLLQQVSDVVPFKSLTPGIQRAMGHG